MSLRKPKEHKQVILLRKEGRSIKEIAKMLNLSSSTVSLWTRNIVLSTAQKQKLIKRVFRALQNGRKKAQDAKKKIREEQKKKIINEALKNLGKISKRDLFIIGISLYWGEGFKKDSRLGFANSDPAMIKLFVNWLIINGVPEKDIRLRVGLNISHKNRIKAVEKYWSEQTKIPLTQFQKPFFQKFTWKKEFPDPEKYFGVLRIRANNQVSLFIKIQAWIEGLRKQL